MFQKILVISEVEVDFQIVLNTILNLRQFGTRECVLLQCLSPQELNETLTTLIMDIYNQSLETHKQFLEERGFAVTVKKTIGTWKESIYSVAREENCALLVASAAERTLLGDLFFGGAASHLIYHPSLPVLLIRMPGQPKPGEAELAEYELTGHVVFPTDFSENADQAFHIVKQLVACGIKKVSLVHVQDKAKIEPHLLDRLEEFNRLDSAKLQTMSADLKAINNIDVITRIYYGSPTAEILKFIQDEGVSMVVMGRQGRGFIKEIYAGSVSNNITRHSPVPVLLVPIRHD